VMPPPTTRILPLTGADLSAVMLSSVKSDRCVPYFDSDRREWRLRPFAPLVDPLCPVASTVPRLGTTANG